MENASSFVRAAAAQINPTLGDLANNTEKIIQRIENARQMGVQILVFPELCICGYPPKDLLLKTQFIDDQIKQLERIIPHTQGMLALVGLVIREGDSYNAAAILHDGQWIGTSRKVNLPNYQVFDEKRYFQASEDLTVISTDHADIGVTICEDIWHPETVAQIASTGVDLIVNLSASPFSINRAIDREIMIKTRCQDHRIGMVFCNQVGAQDELIFDGRSLLVSPQAQIIAQGKAFEEDLVMGDFHFESIHRGRLAVPLQRDHLATGVMERLPVTMLYSEGKTTPNPQPSEEWNVSKNPFAYKPVSFSYNPVEDACHALVLGVRDYMRKNGFKSVILGLSGGIDSALTAAIAVEALGKENVTGVAMPSHYSTEHSKSDAQQLTENLGIDFKLFEIHELFKAYQELFKDEFTGLKEDITEENLQARARGTLLMALSNKFGHLVLATGNKSEMAVGYATLYGDMCGGLAVIADVPKTLVYQISRFINENAGREIIPRNTIEKPPSAELRADQKDTDSLPDYDILDGILHAYIELDYSIAEIIELGYDEETVRRIVRMVDAAEYKRRQAAIILRVTSKAFGSDRRLPVTNKYRS